LKNLTASNKPDIPSLIHIVAMFVIIICDLKFVGMYYTALADRKFHVSSFNYSAVIATIPDVKHRSCVLSKDIQSQAIFLDTNVIDNSLTIILLMWRIG
jgi:hypothetical protein